MPRTVLYFDKNRIWWSAEVSGEGTSDARIKLLNQFLDLRSLPSDVYSAAYAFNQPSLISIKKSKEGEGIYRCVSQVTPLSAEFTLDISALSPEQQHLLLK